MESVRDTSAGQWGPPAHSRRRGLSEILSLSGRRVPAVVAENKHFPAPVGPVIEHPAYARWSERESLSKQRISGTLGGRRQVPTSAGLELLRSSLLPQGNRIDPLEGTGIQRGAIGGVGQ